LFSLLGALVDERLARRLVCRGSKLLLIELKLVECSVSYRVSEVQDSRRSVARYLAATELGRRSSLPMRVRRRCASRSIQCEQVGELGSQVTDMVQVDGGVLFWLSLSVKLLLF